MTLIILATLLMTQPVPFEKGVASYYTRHESGAKTASGEWFNDAAMTCAMRDGEFGTHYRVVADNGRSVIVRLNDRGPYVEGRDIDLSRAAMRKLHKTAGLLRVMIYKLE